MAAERSRRDRLLDVGWVILLIGAAVALRQRSALFQVSAFAILIAFLGWQTVAKLTHRRTRFDTANAHIGFFLTAAFMVIGGGAQVFAPQPNTAGIVRVLGGLTASPVW
jgi:predicted PurR-regulated permease PerM